MATNTTIIFIEQHHDHHPFRDPSVAATIVGLVLSVCVLLFWCCLFGGILCLCIKSFSRANTGDTVTPAYIVTPAKLATAHEERRSLVRAPPHDMA